MALAYFSKVTRMDVAECRLPPVGVSALRGVLAEATLKMRSRLGQVTVPDCSMSCNDKYILHMVKPAAKLLISA